MKIAIVSSGRQHFLNLAVELQNLGHDVRFYSFVTPGFAERFGLKRENCRTQILWVLPLLVLLRQRVFKLPRPIKAWAQFLVELFVDIAASLFMEPCDVMIGHSLVAYRSAKAAKRKYGAKIICDVGTKHIEVVDRILAKVGGVEHFGRTVKRSLAFYEIADRITIPATHALQSFLDEGFPREKLFCNPYGCDLEHFKPTALEKTAADVIFVGNWGLGKGCDLLCKACLEELKVKLLHVGGSRDDYPYPDSPLFTHIDPVPQNELPKYYARAKVFCLASRAEGFALVLFQAVACGLPVVYSPETGGTDMRDLIGDSPFLIKMEALDVKSLSKALSAALAAADSVPAPDGKRDYAGKAREALSWQAYGRRYSQFLENFLSASSN